MGRKSWPWFSLLTVSLVLFLADNIYVASAASKLHGHVSAYSSSLVRHTHNLGIQLQVCKGLASLYLEQ